MKKIMFLVCFMVVLSSNFAFCSEENLSNLNLGIEYSNEEISINSQLENEKDNLIQADSEKESVLSSLKAMLFSLPEGEFYSLDVNHYVQEKTYWCGPASARQTLSFHKNDSGSSSSLPSQSTLASKIGTTSAGSGSVQIKNALNSYASKYSFSGDKYVVGNISDKSDPTWTFETRIKSAVKKETNAPIVLFRSQYLPRYNGKSVGHYNTVYGYSYEYSSNEKSIGMVDPHYDSRYSGKFWDPMGSTSTDGVVKAVYKCDKGTSNYVMIY